MASRGRPRKSQQAEVINTENASVDAKVTELNQLGEIFKMFQELKQENEQLKAKIEDLTINHDKSKEIEDDNFNLSDDNSMLYTEVSVGKEIVDDNDTFDSVEIPENAYIKVMSLMPWQLNLSTEGRGRGRIYTFEELYQTKRIIYSDLNKILDIHPTFLKNGYYIILDDRVIRKHGFDDYYKKILTKEKIEQILTGSKDAISLFKTANKEQQQIIIEIFIKNYVDKKGNVNLNLYDKISRLSGTNIVSKAEEIISTNGMLLDEYGDNKK